MRPEPSRPARPTISPAPTVKATSLASVIQYPEVLHNAENIYYANSRVIELLIVAGLWYLLVVSVLTPLQMLLERRFARGTTRIGR